jgi:cytoskeleton protein RodZ
VESFGARLKREREQRKITLEEISLSTKIAGRFLLAIEEEHFDRLPGGIFNKGFVKAYARYLGLDEAQTVADYELASAPSPPPNQPGIAGPGSPGLPIQEFPGEDYGDPASRVPWGWFAVALLVVACGLALWGGIRGQKPSRTRRMPSPPASEDTSARAPSAGGQSIVPHTGGGPIVPAAPAPGRASGSRAPESDPRVAVQEPRPPNLPPDSVTGPGAFLVQIKARKDSWVAISADGRQIMQDTLYASAEKSVGARDQVVIKTGNAGALDISFNGKRLPNQGALNEVKTLTFNPNGPQL